MGTIFEGDTMLKTWCLLKEYVDKFKKGLSDREIDPNKLILMSSAERNVFFAKYVGADNAQQVNALFESKLLLKNQVEGYTTWAKKVVGVTPAIRRDLLSRIEKMDKVLNPGEEKAFLQDLASTKLGINVTQEEAKNISELSKKIVDLKKNASEEGIFPTPTQRLEYGASKVTMENYINDLKLKAKRISFKEQPIKKIMSGIGEVPGILKSTVASFDNSFWGRQGVKALYTSPDVWTKNFLKSWGDIARQTFAKGKWYRSGDDAVIDSIKADIYSRPNSLNDKYKVGGYGLDFLSEEAYPSSWPEKIPVLGRIFKASEIAYNGGALRLRADLADRLIKLAEKNGVNTLDPNEAKGMGHLISSLTGKGSLGKGEPLAKEINVLLFSAKFLKGNINTLTAHAFDPKASKFVKKQAAKNLLRIILTITGILSIAKMLDPNSVDEDPRSTNFGKVKIFGHWTDITGGLAMLVTLASRLIPSYHNGKWSFWKKTANGNWIDLRSGGYGKETALDIVESFAEGKLSPVAGILRDQWAGRNFQGQVPTTETIIKGQMPLSIQNTQQLIKDPQSSFVVGSMILDGLGFSVSNTVEPNSKTNLIPTDKKMSNESLIQSVVTYAQAFGTDPETAFNRIFTGQKIRRVTNGTIIVERMPLKDSQEVKKKANANTPAVKLDHIVPLELGGSNETKNLKLVTTSEWSSYTKVENALGSALKAKKISKKEAQNEITKFKNITNTAQRKTYGDNLIKKYK
jgi:hypothetical protein